MQHWTFEQRTKHRAEVIGLVVRMKESGQMQFTRNGEVLTGWLLPEPSADWLAARETEAVARA